GRRVPGRRDSVQGQLETWAYSIPFAIVALPSRRGGSVALARNGGIMASRRAIPGRIYVRNLCDLNRCSRSVQDQPVVVPVSPDRPRETVHARRGQFGPQLAHGAADRLGRCHVTIPYVAEQAVIRDVVVGAAHQPHEETEAFGVAQEAAALSVEN